MQNEHPIDSATQEIRDAARDMLRMGSRWAHSALDWIDERRHDMNNRSRDERNERDDRNERPQRASAWQDRDRQAQQERPYGGRREQLQGRSDRDIQGDYSGGGYDQVGSHWNRGSDETQRGYGRDERFARSRSASPDDDSLRGDYGSSGYGRSGSGVESGAGGYGGAGYGYGASAPGGVGYGAPGYGAGSSYAEGGYRGDFQSRGLGEDEGYGSYGQESVGRRGDTAGFGRDYSRGASAQGRGQEGYGQSWREQQAAGRQYGGREYSSDSDRSYGAASGYGASGYGAPGYGTSGNAGSRDDGRSSFGYGDRGSQWEDRSRHGSGVAQSGLAGRSYRGVGPRNYTRSDERIREDLNERLTDAHDIDASMITVEVNNGVATLSGTVNERWMKHRAEDIADGCTGVRDVRNTIQVNPRSSQSDVGSRSQQATSYGSSQSSGSGQSGSASGTQGSSLGASGATSQGSGSSTGSSGATSGSSTASGSSGRGTSSGGSPTV